MAARRLSVHPLDHYPQPWRIEEDPYCSLIVAANGDIVADLPGPAPSARVLAEYILAATSALSIEQHLCKHPPEKGRERTESYCGACGKVSL